MEETHSDTKDTVTDEFRWYRDFFKRGFDLFFCSLSFIVAMIPMAIVALIIKLSSFHEPVLFKQKRVGKNGELFTILKFRTMRDDAPHGVATENFDHPEQYITKFGKFLRKTSLDELPQLFNVFKGEMSMIGPRPLIPSEKQVLQWRDQLGATTVLPGITGLAQVNGRDELVGKKKAEIDSHYAHNVSICLDLDIFFKTLTDVIHSRGIHEGRN